MSLKEFLSEEKQVRKQMRAERKQHKKHPKTKREKIYKIAGIICTIAIICGALLYTCRNLSSGYDWENISGITTEIKEKLEKDVDKSLIVGDFEITSSDEESCKAKLQSVGIDYSQINTLGTYQPSSSFSLNSGEAGAIAKSLLGEINDGKYELVAFKLYSDISYVYEVSVIKVNLSKYISSSKLPDIYISTTSKCEIQNKELTALNYVSTINNLTLDESEEILDLLNNNILISNLKKIACDEVNSAINTLNIVFDTKLDVTSDTISFLKK